MSTEKQTSITIETTVNATIEKVWDFWNTPEHIMQWYFATPDWHCPDAENDLKVNGHFKTTMAAKDDSFSFDFSGVYTTVNQNELIEYKLDDGRKVKTSFIADNNQTKIIQTFEAEDTNPVEMQRSGWQAILDNFKRYIEAN